MFIPWSVRCVWPSIEAPNGFLHASFCAKNQDSRSRHGNSCLQGVRAASIERQDNFQDAADVAGFPVGLGRVGVGVMAMDAGRQHDIGGCKAQRGSPLIFLEAVEGLVGGFPQSLEGVSFKVVLEAAVLAPRKGMVAVNAGDLAVLVAVDAPAQVLHEGGP